jgi:uncharacterized protein with NRDE domain
VCTLAVGFQLDRRWPLVVAANRDEHLGRPAEGWALRGGGGAPAFAAPLDLQAGGTWIGVGPGGLFAGLTNHYLRFDGYPDPTRSSRGELVPLALAAGSAALAAAALRPLDAARYNPFHLLLADARDAFLFYYDGVEQGLEPLAPGLHVLTERDREGRGPRAEWLRARWPFDLSLPHLRELLTHHADPAGSPSATCIHGEPVYGSRSSAILRLSADLSTSELFVADGPPCISPHLDRSEVLRELSRRA